MERKSSSRKKPSKKVASPSPSTTSSTIGSNSTNETDSQKAIGPPRKFDDTQQNLFLDHLARGASPAVACLKENLDLDEVNRAYENNEEFRQRWDNTNRELGRNVVAALYRSAIEGSVTAQTFWLKHRPPPDWSPEQEMSRDSVMEELEQMSDEQLMELARTAGIDLPASSETGTSATCDEAGSREVSEDD